MLAERAKKLIFRHHAKSCSTKQQTSSPTRATAMVESRWGKRQLGGRNLFRLDGSSTPRGVRMAGNDRTSTAWVPPPPPQAAQHTGSFHASTSSIARSDSSPRRMINNELAWDPATATPRGERAATPRGGKEQQSKSPTEMAPLNDRSEAWTSKLIAELRAAEERKLAAREVSEGWTLQLPPPPPMPPHLQKALLPERYRYMHELSVDDLRRLAEHAEYEEKERERLRSRSSHTFLRSWQPATGVPRPSTPRPRPDTPRSKARRYRHRWLGERRGHADPLLAESPRSWARRLSTENPLPTQPLDQFEKMQEGVMKSRVQLARDEFTNQQQRKFNDAQLIFNVPPIQNPIRRFHDTLAREAAHEAAFPASARFQDRLMRPTNANEMARSSFLPPDVYERAAALAAYNDAPDANDVAAAAKAAQRAGIVLSASAPELPAHGQDNFKACNHFAKGDASFMRFERGLPPRYAGYHPRQLMPDRFSGYKIGENVMPPMQYSRDRREQLWRSEPWSRTAASMDPHFSNVTC